MTGEYEITANAGISAKVLAYDRRDAIEQFQDMIGDTYFHDIELGDCEVQLEIDNEGVEAHRTGETTIDDLRYLLQTGDQFEDEKRNRYILKDIPTDGPLFEMRVNAPSEEDIVIHSLQLTVEEFEESDLEKV